MGSRAERNKSQPIHTKLPSANQDYFYSLRLTCNDFHVIAVSLQIALASHAFWWSGPTLLGTSLAFHLCQIRKC